MNNLNSILLEGNLTRDPDHKVTEAGNAVCNFCIASNRYHKNDAGEMIQTVDYFNITAWNGLADTCSTYLKKGRGVRVVGRLKQERWTDNEGDPHEKVIVVAEHVEFKPLFTKKAT